MNKREKELLKQLEEAKKLIQQQNELIFKQEQQLQEKDNINDNLKKELAKAYRLLEKQLDEVERKNEIIKKNNYEKFFSKDESTSKILRKSRTVTSFEKGKVGRKKGSKNFKDILDVTPDNIIYLDPIEFVDASNKDNFKLIGNDACFKIERVPSKYVLTKIIKNKYLDKSNNKIVQPLSNFVFGNSIITPSFVSNAIYLKYCLCLPINKLSNHIKSEMGISISNSNWWNYFDKASVLLEPIYNQIRLDLINNDAKIIHADETTVSISKLKQENRKKSYVLVSTSSYYSTPICLFEFINERKVMDNTDTISSFDGYLVTDGFNGYSSLNPNIQRCWVHARRYVADSIKVSSDPDLPQIQLLNEINKLFDIERDIQNYSPNTILKLRKEKSIPVLNDIKNICNQYKNTKIDSFNKAINYILNNFDQLSTFLKDGKIPIHNNKAERTISFFVQARKNFQTISTEESAIKNMKLFTITHTAKANGLNVEKYLNYVFNNLDKPIASLLPYCKDLPDDLKLQLN